MDAYDFDVRLTPAARELLRPDEALVLDARKTLGVRRFVSSLPGDFGLRAVMGRLPEPSRTNS